MGALDLCVEGWKKKDVWMTYGLLVPSFPGLSTVDRLHTKTGQWEGLGTRLACWCFSAQLIKVTHATIQNKAFIHMMIQN